MTIPHNKCLIHNRRSPKTGRCMECQRLKGLKYRDRKRRGLPTADCVYLPPKIIAALLRSWGPPPCP